MTIPDFQSLMLPLLRIAGDGQEHSHKEIRSALAEQFHLDEKDLKEMLPSGRQLRFDNRTAWSRAYLKKAGLIEATGRGRVRITNAGIELLKSNPARIDIKLLMKYPEFKDFRGEEPTKKTPQTPEEIIADCYVNLRQEWAQELLDRIMSCSPAFFERLVVELLQEMGYGGSGGNAGKVVGKSGDGGIDGIINEDKLGLDVVYIQAKRWEGPIGSPVVHQFVGCLDGQKAKKGILITTSRFSQDARDFIAKTDKRVILIDGERLTQLMIEHGIGVSKVHSYDVYKVDPDYFDEEI